MDIIRFLFMCFRLKVHCFSTDVNKDCVSIIMIGYVLLVFSSQGPLKDLF